MILKMQDICKEYPMGKSVAKILKNVSLEVEEGDYLAIMGPSGSGKTTLMNLIGCLDMPTSGSYELGGRDMTALEDNELADVRNKEIGFVFQSFNLLPKLTALDNVALPLVYAGVKKPERQEMAKEALKIVGLEDRMTFFPNQLSGGQCQRVAIARAIVGKPKLLLADEPTGALDTASGKQIMELFEELHKNGSTIIMITHDRNVAEKAAKVWYIRDGILSDTRLVTEDENLGETISFEEVRNQLALSGEGEELLLQEEDAEPAEEAEAILPVKEIFENEEIPIIDASRIAKLYEAFMPEESDVSAIEEEIRAEYPEVFCGETDSKESEEMPEEAVEEACEPLPEKAEELLTEDNSSSEEPEELMTEGEPVEEGVSLLEESEKTMIEGVLLPEEAEALIEDSELLPKKSEEPAFDTELLPEEAEVLAEEEVPLSGKSEETSLADNLLSKDAEAFIEDGWMVMGSDAFADDEEYIGLENAEPLNEEPAAEVPLEENKGNDKKQKKAKSRRVEYGVFSKENRS